MNADDRPPTDDDGSEPAVAGSLRVLLAAHVDDDIVTDATWAAIERGAVARRAARLRRRTTAVTVLAAAALLVVFVVIRIEGARRDDVGVTVAEDPTPIPDPTEDLDADSWVRLLARLPATSGSDGSLWIVDLQRAREQAGVPALADGASGPVWQALSQATFGAENILLSPLGTATPEELRAELGFSHEQIDQVVVSYRSPLPCYVATGRFDPDVIAAATAADPLWGPDLDVRQERGVTTYRWGEDGLKLTGKRSPVRDLGTGGRLMVGDGWLAWCYADGDVQAILDASSEPRRSVAADDAVRAAVVAGDDALLTQLVVKRNDVEAPVSRPYIAAPLPELQSIDRPLTWSGGSATSASGRVEQFRLGYSSDGEAAANLDAYRQNWERFAGDQDLTVLQQGSGLVATVLLPPSPDGGGVIGTLSDGTTQRLNPDSFVLYLNVVPRP